MFFIFGGSGSMNISLSHQNLQKLFPFHLALNTSLKIVQLGNKVQKVCPAINIGDSIQQHFVLQRPSILFEFSKIITRLNTPYLLEGVACSCKLKGEMLHLEEDDVLLFLCSPNILGQDSLKDLGLSPKDFPIHSQINDFFFLLNTLSLSLEESKKLTDKLAVQNQELQSREKALKKERKAKELLEIENVRQEMEIAFQIQQALLFGEIPRDISGADIDTLAVASRNVSGDFYDFLPHNTKCLDLVIGDVMGKGVPAAMVAAGIKSRLLRFANSGIQLADYELLPPKAIIEQLHREVTPELIKLNTFATMCYVRFDFLHQRLHILDSGHTNILHFEFSTGQIQKIAGENIPLGVFLETNFIEKTIKFSSEDVFLFYSDGVIEAKNENGVLYGEDRLINFLKENGHLSTSNFLAKLREEIMLFSNNNLHDDLTCIALHMTNSGGDTNYHGVKLIKSRVSEVARVREYIIKNCESIPFFTQNKKALQEVLLATNEVLSNIIRHAYGENPNYVIRVEISISPLWVKIHFVDKGIPFLFPEKDDVKDIRTLAPEEFKDKEGGFGIFLIHHLVDEVCYKRDEQGYNYLYIVKRFHSNVT